MSILAQHNTVNLTFRTKNPNFVVRYDDAFRLQNPQIFRPGGFHSFMSAITAASSAMTGAGFGIGTANALGTAFFRFVNIECRAANDGQ